MIHYEIAYLLLPAMLGGNSLGVVVGRVLPPTLLVVLSLCVLMLAATKTVFKGIHVRQECLAALNPQIASVGGISLHQEAPSSNSPPQVSSSSPPQAGESDTVALAADQERGAREQALISVQSSDQKRMRIPWNVVI